MFVVYSVVMAVVKRRGPEPAALVAESVRELGGSVRGLGHSINEFTQQLAINSQRLARVEAKLDIAMDWTPVSSPVAPLPASTKRGPTEYGPTPTPPHGRPTRHRTSG